MMEPPDDGGVDPVPADHLAMSHAALAAGELADAVAFAAQAFQERPSDPEVLSYAAWIFSGNGRIPDAANCLLALSRHRPLTAAEHSIVASDALNSGKADVAAEHFEAAAALDETEPTYRILAATARGQCGQHREALALLLAEMRNGLPSAQLFHHLSVAARGLKRIRMAIMFARRAVRMAPSELGYRHDLASQLISDRQFAEGALVLDASDQAFVDDSPTRDYLESFSASLQGRHLNSLGDIDRALGKDPTNRSYILHRASILARLHRYDEAADIYDNLLAENPADESLYRAAFAVFTESGRYRAAIKIGALIVAEDEEDPDFVPVFQLVLARRSAQQALEKRATSWEGASEKVGVPPRHRKWRDPAAPGHMLARTIFALFRREMKTRFGRARLGYLWALFEPLAHIGFMILLISAFSHGGLPPIGESFAVFYFTGIIPYHLFTHTAGHLIGSIAENRPLLQIPRVKTVDVYIARALLEGATEIVVAAIFILAFLLIGLKALPLDPIGVACAMVLLWMAAFGIGMINSVLTSFFAGWERIWGALTSIIYFASGTFYIPRIMPTWIRDILVWNPVLQAIEYVRVSYFHEPFPKWLDVPYLAGFAVVALMTGFMLEHVFRRRLLEVE